MIFRKEKSFLRLGFLVLIVIVSLYLSLVVFTPSQMTVLAGEVYRVEFFSPFRLQLSAETGGIHVERMETAYRSSVLSMPYTLKGTQYGQKKVQLSLFGLVPVKDINVNVIPASELIVCGNTVGIRLYIRGILVVGVSGVMTSDGKEVLPARDTGIEPGDFIIAVDNREIERITDLSEIIDKSCGKEITIRFIHDSQVREVKVTPVQSAEDGKYRIGLWVRDSTAGIGTLTYIEEETGKFGALGHGITDIDTGIMMPVKNGELLRSSVYGIRKGLQGSPGELQGDFLKSPEVIGEIYWNTAFGVFGRIDRNVLSGLNGRKYPVGTRSMVKEGPATILSNIHEQEVEEFTVEIQRIARRNLSGPKSMIIKITDPRLLSETGGIIQGMSGSPIIQNGRIIGAVTHVLVNDPTRGYGIFIETMLGMN
ncbi:MAG: SpoIVB peptidase [Clostridiaceae bacterium]|nr:SpoIVB peptidase [Clostridiaceae bacterium]